LSDAVPRRRDERDRLAMTATLPAFFAEAAGASRRARPSSATARAGPTPTSRARRARRRRPERPASVRAISVGILLPNWPEFFAAAFAATSLGAVAVCLNTMATEGELAFYLATRSDATLVYTPRFLKHDYAARLASFGCDRRRPSAAPRRHLETRSPSCATARLPRAALDYSALGPHLPTARLAARSERGRAGHDRGDLLHLGLDRQAQGGAARPSCPRASGPSRRSAAFGLTRTIRSWGCLPMFFAGGFVIIGWSPSRPAAALSCRIISRPSRRSI
jgi:hypothetical protein